jgi:hypothetical protein
MFASVASADVFLQVAAPEHAEADEHVVARIVAADGAEVSRPAEAGIAPDHGP